MDDVKLNIMFLLSLLAGLGLVLFAMRNLASGFQVLFSKTIKKLINSLSINPFKSLFVGVGNSFFIQSELSVAIMAMSYSSSGLLTLTQLILIILGSTLATLPMVWLFCLPTDGLDLYFIVLGVLPMMYASWSKLVAAGRVVFSLGLMFLGFNLMIFRPTESFLSLLNFDIVGQWSHLNVGLFWVLTPLVALLFLLVRSTLALLACIMAMVHSGVMPLTLGLMLVFIVNFSRTLPTFISSFKTGLNPRRGAFANVLINLVGLIVSAFAFTPLFEWLLKVFEGQSHLFILAAGHSIYNIFILVLFFILLKPMEYFLVKVIPGSGKKEVQKLRYVGRTVHMSPILAIEQVYQEVKKMAAMVATTLEMTRETLEDFNQETLERILKYEDITDNIRDEVKEFLSRVMEVSLTAKQGEQVRSLLRMSSELESIADSCKSIVLCIRDMRNLGMVMEGALYDELKKMQVSLLGIYEGAFFQLTEGESLPTGEYRKKVTLFDQKTLNLRKTYLKWLQSEAGSRYEGEAGMKYGDIVNCIYQIRRHTLNLYEAYRYGYRSY